MIFLHSKCLLITMDGRCLIIYLIMLKRLSKVQDSLSHNENQISKIQINLPHNDKIFKSLKFKNIYLILKAHLYRDTDIKFV